MSEKRCGFFHRTEAIDAFTQGDGSLTKAGSAPLRAGLSEEGSIADMWMQPLNFRTGNPDQIYLVA